jgi:DNA-binding CsgD family transcriptional regulator/PAS domain-containing protein
LGKGKPSPKSTEDILLNTHGAVGPLLATLFNSPVIGVAVIDSQIRIRTINRALATMNGFPISSHLGRTLRHVLGSSAPKIEGLMRQVLETGEPISNVEITAQLPARLEVGHWLETYLPVHDFENRVTQVAAFVIELTAGKDLEVCLSHVIGNLLHATAGLKTKQQLFTTTGKWADETAVLLLRAIELIDHCIGHTRNITDISRRYFGAPRLQLDSGRGHAIGIDDKLANAENRVDAGNRWPRILSPREREVLKLLAEGKSNKDIAREMKISGRTAETYRARIMMKLELHSIAHLVHFAVRNNIVDVR